MPRTRFRYPMSCPNSVPAQSREAARLAGPAWQACVRFAAEVISRAEMGRRNKPLVPAYFAAAHPEPPAEVLSLYQKVSAWLSPMAETDESAG